MLILTLLKASTDAREKQELGDQVADIASKTMIGLTKELNRENADMRLTPRVALFPAPRLTVESPALSFRLVCVLEPDGDGAIAGHTHLAGQTVAVAVCAAAPTGAEWR